MSRTATATPPPPYFPSRNSTPSMRHCSPSPVTAARFLPRSPRHQSHQPKRKTKNLPSSFLGALSSSNPNKPAAPPSAEDALGLSFEEISSLDTSSISSQGTRTVESHSSGSTSSSFPSVASRDGEEVVRAPTPSPSMTSSSSASFVATPLATPSSSRAPSLMQSESSVLDGPSDTEFAAPFTMAPAPRASWVPNFGKMAKAVVNTSINMSMPFVEKRRKEVPSPTSAGSTAALLKPDALFVPTFPTAQPDREELERLGEEASMQRRREWAAAEQLRVTECARLCSQWPYSGYNQSKFGPNGAKHFYEPQSYANPQYVASLMSRQAELERWLCESSALFFSCSGSRSSRAASEETDPSLESSEYSQPSPADSMSLSADISAAMASPLIPSLKLNTSQASLVLPDSPKVFRNERSLTDLDALTSSMAIDSSIMDIDLDSLSGSTSSLSRLPVSRPFRAQSCGAKRPMVNQGEEEEKRRKVDEAMVVEEAVASGVIIPASKPTLGSSGIMGQRMSASVPDLSKASVDVNGNSGPALFGHVVKTSDTHPIIISPFFPAELVETIAEHLIVPASLASKIQSSDEPVVVSEVSPFVLASRIDVPSLLLSFVPPQAQSRGRMTGTIVPSPVNSIFLDPNQPPSNTGVQLGNLLLSSCPGKRLRMEGPVKGRGPVCRDLTTDLKRIKSEGVGALVCCLDDPELALLGVPWETYRQVATEIGLDVIRMPMPDGFTPVSLALFDSQVSLIATKYSLRGINVLVHCRGGVGRAGLTACAWAIKMGLVPPHPSLAVVEEAAVRQHQALASQSGRAVEIPMELEHQIIMSVVERVIAMIRARRGLKAIESFEQVQFLASYVRWLRESVRQKGQWRV